MTIWGALVGTYGIDSYCNPITIRVLPGIYETPLYNAGIGEPYCNNRYIRIVGADKDSCILKQCNPCGEFPKTTDGIAAEINCLRLGCGNVKVENLTFISTSESPLDLHKGNYLGGTWRGYCVHIDTDALASESDTIELKNCKFYNDHACCLGIGIDAKQTVILSDCEIVTEVKNMSKVYENTDCAILVHNRAHGSKNAKSPDSYFVVRNCSIKTNRQFAVKAVSVFNSFQTIEFVGNTVHNNGSKPVIYYGTHTLKVL